MFDNDIMGDVVNRTIKMVDGVADVSFIAIGEKKLEFIYKEEPIKIEVWMVFEDAQWGLAKLIRTGPADFNVRVMSFALHKHWHVSDLLLHQHEKSVPGRKDACKRGIDCKLLASTPTEKDVFEVLGLDYLLPEARNVERMVALEKKALGLSEDAAWV
jgi:DNA polymerase/3'-5' exonuclease PolX